MVADGAALRRRTEFTGALGALIYHLREFLSSTLPDPTLLKMVVRVGLGAFAGNAIGWFWMPTDASVLGIPEFAFIPLTIAFIVGSASMRSSRCLTALLWRSTAGSQERGMPHRDIRLLFRSCLSAGGGPTLRSKQRPPPPAEDLAPPLGPDAGVGADWGVAG